MKRHMSEPNVKIGASKRPSVFGEKIDENDPSNRALSLDWVYGCDFSSASILFVTKQEPVL